MLEKDKILIRKIRNNCLQEKFDEVAIEQQLCIPLPDGSEIVVTCTPTHLEEMTAARKYLAVQSQKKQSEKKQSEKIQRENLVVSENASMTWRMSERKLPKDGMKAVLEEVSLGEIFGIARDSFENPGPLFTDTGCAHSCALIYQGKLTCCIEDIGRHNALDKVIGYALLHEIPISESYVFTSGRISADYLQKVIDAGFLLVASRAAVTANAVELAKQHNITLLGFIRKNTGNLYWEGAVKICEEQKHSEADDGDGEQMAGVRVMSLRSDSKNKALRIDYKQVYSVILLAGGKSSRMGKNKAELLYDGKTFLENLILKVKELGISDIYVSGFETNREDVTVVRDIYTDRGPLGGIHACMKQAKTPFCLVLPVDVPQIPKEVLEDLLMFHVKHTFGYLAGYGENAVPADKKNLPVVLKHGERLENLIGIYPVEMMDFIEERIWQHSASVHGMLRAWGMYCWEAEFDEWRVENINTQEAYEALLANSALDEKAEKIVTIKRVEEDEVFGLKRQS